MAARNGRSQPSYRIKYTGDYTRRAKALRATATPHTRCAQPGCGRLLHEHPPHRDGQPPRWQAGHVRDFDPTADPHTLALIASTCNERAGGRHGKAIQVARTPRGRASPNA